jgi:hypothetical protein
MLACAGCTPGVAKLKVTNIAASDAAPLVDARPASEKQEKIFSYLISSQEYGITRVGEGRLSPSPVRLLQHEVFLKFAPTGQQPKVTVRHLVIYQNMRAQLRAGAIGAGFGGVIGALIGNAATSHDAAIHSHAVDASSFSGSEEYQRGQYTTSENPNAASVYVVYVGTEIDGRKVFTRTVAPTKGQGDQDPLAVATQQAIKAHLAEYDRIVARTPAPVAPANDSTAVAATSVTQEAAQDGGLMAMAQNVAKRLGCGAVRAGADSTFLASCGAYDVVIDCDGGQCRPTHTVKAEQS